MRSAVSIFSRFGAERSGNMTMLFGLSLGVIAAAVGVSIDYGRALALHTRLQAAMDSGLLASVAASGGDHSKVEKALEQYIASTWAASHALPPVKLNSSGGSDGLVSATGTLVMNTTFMSLFGKSTMDISVLSNVQAGAGSSEIALVLDNTGSMMGSKLAGLQTASKGLIDALYANPNASKDLKVGVVPFNYYVNVGTQYRAAPWLHVADDYSVPGSAVETLYSYTHTTVSGTCWTDNISYPCTYDDWTQIPGSGVTQTVNWTTYYTWNGCVGSADAPFDMQAAVSPGHPVPGIMNFSPGDPNYNYGAPMPFATTWASCPLPLIRLTTDPAAIKSQIDSMVAVGETYIASGLAWGWRLLAPDGPFADGSAYGKHPKIIVLMTDGANTHSPLYPDHEGWDRALADSKTLELCANIKATGIKIYTIAFDMPDQASKDLLATCASGPPYYYDTNTVSDLAAAFSSIGGSLTALRIAN